MNKAITHTELQERARWWLYSRGCGVFANEVPHNGEMVDALGLLATCHQHLDYKIYAIEVKVSNSDLRCKKQQYRYEFSIEYPKVHHYYLMVADGVNVSDNLYPFWGVINQSGKVIRKAKNLKPADLDFTRIMENIAHKLVYIAYGKMYLIDKEAHNGKS